MSRERFLSRRGKRRGLTVAHILLSVFVFLLLSPFLIQALGMAAEQALCCADRRKAMNRIAAVENFLKSPALYCGLGVPLEPEAYRRALGNVNYMPFNWDGPVSTGTLSIQFGQPTRPDGLLFIAYSQPGSVRMKEDTVVGGSITTFSLHTSPAESEIKSMLKGGTIETQNWITFPGSVPQKKPLLVRSLIGASVGAECPTGEAVSIQKNDRACLFRALRIFADKDILYTVDYRTSGTQPRIFGIKDIRFEVDLEKQKLTAYVLARGDREHKTVQAIANVEGWPEKYHSTWAGTKAGKQQLFAKKIVWGLPNCTKTNVLAASDVRERF